MNNKIIIRIIAIITPFIVGWVIWTTNNVYSFQKTEQNQSKIEKKIDKLADKMDTGFDTLNKKIDNYAIRNNEEILEIWKEKKEQTP